MPLWKSILAYDGTPFNGWQVQPGLPTVQGTLAHAIHHVTGETVLPQGSGRTDTGVHALAQVASFSLEVPIPAANLHRALNRALPSSIRVLSLEIAEPGFHARHSAIGKIYEYRIFPSRPHPAPLIDDTMPLICSPMVAPFVWDCPFRLDLAALQNAADAVLGTHDFTSFAASDPDLSTRIAEASTPNETPLHASAIRTISHSSWQRRDDLLIYRVTGSGFLHHMVRNLVGTFAEVGNGRLPADAIPRILAARDRSAAGPTAPARGLFLVEVAYSKSEGAL
jgi:tRNA pseudouridine38-40 synthase